jgi:hypothetical protein
LSIIDKVIEYSKLERKYAEELKTMAESIKHPVLRALFLSISQDSLKHSLMYEAITQLLEQTQPFITIEELRKITTTIEKHIETEIKMLEEAKKIFSTSQDPRVKLITAAIINDEINHHILLLDIKKRIAEEEALTEEKIWDMIWKESPWHGTPGG